MTKRILLVLLLSGCGPSVPVTCTGVRPMVCECVEACVTTKEDVQVSGVTCEPLCYVEK